MKENNFEGIDFKRPKLSWKDWAILGQTIFIFYFMGVSGARYLLGTIDFGAVVLGLFWSYSVPLVWVFVRRYISYDKSLKNNKPNDTERLWKLFYAVFAILINCTLSVLIFKTGGGEMGMVVLLAMTLFCCGVLCVPQILLKYQGVGEILVAVMIGVLMPMVGFHLVFQSLHKLIIALVIPLTFLLAAMIFIGEMPGLISFIHRKQPLVIVSFGWERIVSIFSYLVLFGYLGFGIGTFFSLPLFIAVPVLVVLPLSIFSLWYIGLIAKGIKPNWNVFTWMILGQLWLIPYLITFMFWIN